MRAFSATFAFELLRRSRRRDLPRSSARITTTGMPLSMQVTSMPSIASTAEPVGSSEPQLEPATSRNSIGIAAAVPGTPSMRASPSYSTAPPGVGTCATAMLPVFTMWMRTGVVAPATGTSPFSIAHGPTPARMLPQFWLSLTSRLVDHDLQEQVVDIGIVAPSSAR